MTTTTPRSAPVKGAGLDPLRAVDRAVYSDPGVFDAEQEKIFAKVWQFACHASELSTAGSFVTIDLAGASVIVARGSDDEVRAFYNTCRHRGAQVVTDESGQCRQFRCPYHAWVYDLDGALVGVPGQEAYDYESSGFDKALLGLVPVRCEQSYGFIFVCADTEAPGLEEYLGNATDVLRQFFGQGDFEVIHQTRYPMRANWKLYPENSRDGYHVPFLHALFRKGSPPRHYSLLDNGHAIQYLAVDQGDMSDEQFQKISANTLPGLQKNEGFAMQIWPHLLVLARNNFVMVESVHPVSATETAMQGRVLGVKGDRPEVRELRLAAWDEWANEPNLKEDIPVIESQQVGMRCAAVPFVLINRGGDNVEGVRGDDNRVRQFWTQWRSRLGTRLNSVSSDFNPDLTAL